MCPLLTRLHSYWGTWDDLDHSLGQVAMYECDTGYEFTDAAATADGAAAALAAGRNVSCEEMADGSGGAEWSNPHGVPGDCWSKL